MSKTAMIWMPPDLLLTSQPVRSTANDNFLGAVRCANDFPDTIEISGVNKLIGGHNVPAVRVATRFGEAVAYIGRMRPDVRGSRGNGNHFHVVWVDGESWEQSETTTLRAFMAGASILIQDVPIRRLARILPPLYERIMKDPTTIIPLPFDADRWSQRVMRSVRNACVDPKNKRGEDALDSKSNLKRVKRGRYGEAVITLQQGASFQGRLTEIGDAHVSFQAPNYTRSGFDELFIVKTPRYFEHVVNWNRAFMLCQGIINVKPFFLFTHVERPNRFRTSHSTIRNGLSQLLGEELDLHEIARLELSRGYIRQGQNDRHEIYSLSGAKMFEPDGSLSEQSIRVREAFKTLLDVDVDIIPHNEKSLRSRIT